MAARYADPYALEFTPLDPAKPKAVDAIAGLFTRSSDFLQRNLMYCDHTIHALHLEALVFAESKRRAAGDTAWLDGVVATKPAGWLRLYHPLVSPGALQPTQGKFLAGSGEPDFFQHMPVRPQELQVGDHLIVYNHPAYEHSTLHGAWRLENAVVVQTTPELLVQGHGSPIMRIASAKAHMLDLFVKALNICRAALRPLAKVTASAGSTAVKVDSTSAVRVGMKIDVIEAATETPIAQQRKVTRVDARAKTVEFDGAAVAATAKHALRRAHRPQFGGKFDSLFLASPTSAQRDLPAATRRPRGVRICPRQPGWRLARRLGGPPARGEDPARRQTGRVRQEAALRRLHGGEGRRRSRRPSAGSRSTNR